MPRYCDVNNDKKITLSEWLNCLNAHGSGKEVMKTSTSECNFLSEQEYADNKMRSYFPDEIKPTSQTSKLKGPNPLESYLKSD